MLENNLQWIRLFHGKLYSERNCYSLFPALDLQCGRCFQSNLLSRENRCPPLNLSFLLLHNEGFFYQGSGELQHFKRFCFEKNIYWNDLPFHAKDDEPHNQSFCSMFKQYIVRFASANSPKRTSNLQHILFYSCGHARP